ncbi:hypothetical protein GLOTRDRAFT_137872 [Gloeophyllum trabeum ATCC 11539]|uniref:Alpha/beta-hydrolase n=1 Tax=Gloeophyllum trabeum (strain ATCC 11539 / FP-39264 / Madison 617) TaxID=670483 RepID=S7QE55_GLOTA|nr:uncharacterized protein GLOTRDRAFT_137872 [Gloeophyllum trabeum ATCC 11539]EPQ57573.1 hypothetical protein GLOTRDRAFT_137872 [Gloeophyllum trabeum ATCC 11539]
MAWAMGGEARYAELLSNTYGHRRLGPAAPCSTSSRAPTSPANAAPSSPRAQRVRNANTRGRATAGGADPCSTSTRAPTSPANAAPSPPTGNDKKKRKKKKKKKVCECGHNASLHAAEDGSSARAPAKSGRDSLMYSIVDTYSNGFKRLQMPEKTSEENARKEAVAGLRAVQDDEDDGRALVKGRGGKTRFKPSISKSKSKPEFKTKKTSAMKGVTVGGVVMVPYGLKSNGKLKRDRTPTPNDIEGGKHGEKGYRESRLFTEGVFQFYKEWSMQAIDNWLHDLFPEVFAYMDARYGSPEEGCYHWALLTRNRQRLIAVCKSEVTGTDLHKVRGVGRSPEDMKLYFTTKKPLPKQVYENWELATEQARQGHTEPMSPTEDLGDPTTDEELLGVSDDGQTGLDPTPPPRPQPRPAYKGKSRVISGRGGKLSVLTPSEPSGSSDEGDDGGEDHGNGEVAGPGHQSVQRYGKGKELATTERVKPAGYKRLTLDDSDSDIEWVKGPAKKAKDVLGSPQVKTSVADPLMPAPGLFDNGWGDFSFGGSGSGLSFEAGQSLSAVLKGQYDIIGFDPRGVKQSEPYISCFDSLYDQEMFSRATRNFGLNLPSNISAYVGEDLTRQLGLVSSNISSLSAQCYQRTGDVLKFMGTEAVVHDIDTMVKAFDGENALINYWGWSYGTIIGQYMVQILPPERLGRIIIDGVVDSQLWANDPLSETPSTTTEIGDVLQGFADSCAAAGAACPLSKLTSSGIIAKINATLDSLYASPVSVADVGYPAVADASLLRGVLQNGMYSIIDWPDLASTLDQVFTGNYTPLVQAILPPIDANDKTKPDLSAYANAVIACNDARQLDPSPSVQQESDKIIQALQQNSPQIGELGYTAHLCQYWPSIYYSQSRYNGSIGLPDGILKTPILIFTQGNDPVTPSTNAERAAQRLGNNARLLEQPGGFGHTAMSQMSFCTLPIVQSYMLYGKAPDNDRTVCQVNQLPFVSWNASAAENTTEGLDLESRQAWVALNGQLF